MTNPTRRSWALASLFLSASFAAVAQPAPPAFRSTTFYTVKPDRVGDFLAATKDYAEAIRKAGGDRHFSVWMSLSGERDYVFVRNHAKLAELDTPQDPKLKDAAAQLTAITGRIMNCVESSRRVIQGLDSELSLALPNSPNQPLARVLRTWVRPDKTADYRALIKSEILPAARKSGLKLYSVSAVRYGGATNEFNSVMGFDKWADLDGDGPIVEGLGGRDAYNKFLAKLRPLITRSEVQVYRLLKDQSYLP